MTGKHSDKASVGLSITDLDDEMQMIANDGSSVELNTVGFSNAKHSSFDLGFVFDQEEGARSEGPAGAKHEVDGVFGGEGSLSSSLAMKQGSAKGP